MKYTRLDLHSGLSESALKNIVIFFIIIPIAAISVGKMITGFIVVPYISNKLQPAVYTVNYEDENNKIDFYLLQAGVFMNKENAQILEKGIKQINSNALVIKDSDSYRVIADISEDKNIVENVQANLKKSGYNCIINHLSFNSENSNKAVSENMYTIIELLKSEEEIIKNLENNKSISTEEMEKARKNTADTYDKIKTDNKDNALNDGIIKSCDMIMKSADTFTASAAKKDILSLKICITEQLIEFKNIYEKYSQSK